MKPGALAAFLALCLAGCAIGDPRYPPQWDPLEPPRALDCRGFEGAYADRGEAPEPRRNPSFTRELFGPHSAWEKAERVELRFAGDDLEVAVWAGERHIFARTLSAAAGEVKCESGRLVLRNVRWVAEVLIAGREDMTMELHDRGDDVVAAVDE
ncbi:MAG TPA: hypothetical protein VML57_09440, partial [Burkholderiales bacterium]|nr:hypothetical protein [Burkholderiales bacterium]